jgi:hypothetical protein
MAGRQKNVTDMVMHNAVAGSVPYTDPVTGVMLWLPPGTSGHFLRTNGAGAAPSWAAGGGGGGGGGDAPVWVTGHPDTPPETPHASDREFNTGDTIGGTTRGAPATAPVINDNRLVITGGTSGAADTKGVSWTAPSTPFVARTKVTIHTDSQNYAISSISLLHPGTMKFKQASMFINSGNNHADFWTQWQSYTALTTRFAFGSQRPYWGPTSYLEAAYDGTNILLRSSSDGREGNWRTLVSETVATFFGTDLPTEVMLSVDSFSGGPCVALFDFLRYT